jgi:hypothetical protein
MAYSPAMRSVVRPRNSHNDAMKRIYKNWTPEDLAVLERQAQWFRPAIVAMVRDDYAQAVYTTSRVVLYGTARYVRKAYGTQVRVRKPKLRVVRNEPGVHGGECGKDG